jgi:putative nucleotidyltransferase-like protein
MTRSPLNGAGHIVDVQSLRLLLRLCLGVEKVDVTADWSAILALALRERVAGIAWKQSADVIRREAPRPTSDDWQRRAVSLGLHCARQVAELSEAIAALSLAEVDVVVMKGAPLAVRVYGDFTVRPTLDIDLHVPRSQRTAATAVLESVGWHHASGVAPEEETFERHGPGGSFRLEVHSSPLDDPLLEHLDFPVECELVSVGESQLPAHGGRFLPAYLAAHMAKHRELRLLWMLDFHLLWSRSSSAYRKAARSSAREIGLGRHLEWAIAVTDDISASRLATEEAAEPLGRVGRALTTISDAARLRRLIALSASPSQSLRVLLGRAWPVAWRRGWRSAPEYFVRRAIRWAYRRSVFERPSTSIDPTQQSTVFLVQDDSATKLVEQLRRAPVWIVPADAAMEPAIPSYAVVRVVPRGMREVTANDVVVMRTRRNRGALQRVCSLGEEEIRVRQDARFGEDSRASLSEVLGICDLVSIGNRTIPVDARPYGTFGLLRAILGSYSDRSIRLDRGHPRRADPQASSSDRR